MKKAILSIIVLILAVQLVFASQQTFTGSVFNAEDGDLLLARINNINFITEVTNGRYMVGVEGENGAEVQFWMKDHVVHRERLKSGTKPLDLDASKVSTQLPPEEDQPLIVTPPQPRIPEVQKTTSLFWIVFLFALLLIAGGIVFYLYKNEWELPFEMPFTIPQFPKINLHWLKKKETVLNGPRIPPKIPAKKHLIPPKIPPKINLNLPPILKEAIGEPEELTPPKSNGAIETIKKYITSMKEKGFDINQIKAALYARGWKKELIEKAMST